MIQVGQKIGNFTLKSTELVGKNKVWDCICPCGSVKRFWKFSTISRAKTCGCGIDSVGLSAKQSRSMKSRMNSYKGGARSRNLEWLLSYDDFVKISTKPCNYCGAGPFKWDCMTNSPSLQKDSPNINPKDYEIYFTGIDRQDSKLGYTIENSVPCCKNCNRAKSDLSFEDFKLHIKKIYECLHQKE